MLVNGCGSADNRVLEDFSEMVYTVDPDAHVSIHNRDGAISVYGSYENEVRVQSLKKAYSQQRLNQIAIDISANPRAVSVTAKIPSRPKWTLRDYSGTVDCTIVLPATASISALDLNAGEVLLDSMRGRQVRARLNDGRMFARNCFTTLDLTVNRGTLHLAYDWWEHEKFSAQVNVGQGNAWIFLPTDAAFRLLARTLNGKIANDFNNVPLITNPAASEMKVDEIVNGGGTAAIQIRVGKGNIKIAEANP